MKVLAGILIAISILMWVSASSDIRKEQKPPVPAGAETAYMMGSLCPSVVLLMIGLMLWQRATAAGRREFRGIK
jgi:uncharacterized membrane protein